MLCTRLEELQGTQWIWTAPAGRRNQYVALRLIIEDVRPDQLPETVPVSVSGGSLYRLYVNGRYLGRGPVREWAGHAGLDRYDLRPWLQPGRNVISALVHYFGEKVGGWPLSPPGFLLAGALGETVVSTGQAPWQAVELDAWNAEAVRISLYNGFNEYVDLERWRPSVWELGGDDADWRAAVSVPDAALERSRLEPRQIPPLSETTLSPMTLRKSDENAMLFEADRMLSGSLEIELTAEAPTEIEIHYGDRLEDGVFVGSHGEVNTSVDRLTVPAGRHRWAGAFMLRGYRYVRLAWNGPALRDVRLTPREIVYPAVDRAIFETSDSSLNRCWEIARLTARLCMVDTYMDNPSRERQQYGGDGYLQGLYGFDLFGDLALWRQFLRHYGQGRRDDGALQAGGPWCWNQIIPVWTLLWIESIGEYYRHTRDQSIAREFADAILDALAWFEPMIGPDGLLAVDECFHWEGGEVLWNFIDWQIETDQLNGEPARLALNGFYAMALRTAGQLLELAGRKDASGACAAHGRQISGRLAALDTLGEHALVAATLAGAVSGRMGEAARLVREHRAQTDVMYLFFTLKALVNEGHPDAAMTLLRDVFEPMMETDHTTFWETRRVSPGSGRAVCQAIGAAPAYWLPRLVAGVREIKALSREVVFGPPLPGINSARVLLPCIDGEIDIITEAGRVCDVRLPEGWRIA